MLLSLFFLLNLILIFLFFLCAILSSLLFAGSFSSALSVTIQLKCGVIIWSYFGCSPERPSYAPSHYYLMPFKNVRFSSTCNGHGRNLIFFISFHSLFLFYFVYFLGYYSVPKTMLLIHQARRLLSSPKIRNVLRKSRTPIISTSYLI